MADMTAESSLKQPAEMSQHQEVVKAPGFRHPKPPYTYFAMTAVAIQRSTNQRLTVNGIHAALEEMFDFFKGDWRGWRTQVRRNLSHKDCFVQIDGPTKNTTQAHWTVKLSLIPAKTFKRTATKETDRWAPDIFQQLGIPDFSLSSSEVTKTPKTKQQPGVKEGPRPSFSIDNILGRGKHVSVGEPIDTKYDHPYSFLAYSLPPVQYGDLVFAPGSSDLPSKFCPPGRYDDMDKDFGYHWQREDYATDLTTSSHQHHFSYDKCTRPQQMYCSQKITNTSEQPQFFRPSQAESCSYDSTNNIYANNVGNSHPVLPYTASATYHYYPSQQPPNFNSDFTNSNLTFQDPPVPLRQPSLFCVSDVYPSHVSLDDSSHNNFNSMRSTGYSISQQHFFNSAMTHNIGDNHQANDHASIANMNAYADTCSNYLSTASNTDHASNQDSPCSTPKTIVTEVDDTELFSDTSSHHVPIPILSDDSQSTYDSDVIDSAEGDYRQFIFRDIDTVSSSSNSTPEDESAYHFGSALCLV